MSFWNALLTYIKWLFIPLSAGYQLAKKVPWIVNGLIFIVGWNLVVAFFEPLFNAFVTFLGYFLVWLVPNFSSEDFQTTVVSLFQLIGSFNSFLPVSETFVALGVLLTYHLARFVVVLVLWFTRRFFDIIP